MTIRPIVITGDPVLHRRAEPVEAFDAALAAGAAPNSCLMRPSSPISGLRARRAARHARAQLRQALTGRALLGADAPQQRVDGRRLDQDGPAWAQQPPRLRLPVLQAVGARGGVYVGGGIVPRLAERFDASPFRERFEAKGRFKKYLQDVPTWVIHSPVSPALQGASQALSLTQWQ